MTRYTYYGFELTSGDVLAELPLVGAAPQWTVNDPGDLGNPTINLGGLTAAKRADIRAATVPYRCGIAVERDTTIVWSGIVTARRYAGSTGVLSLTVPGLLAYWRRRPVTSNRVYTGVEQFDIVGDLLTLDGGPTVPLKMNNPPSGVVRDRSIDGTNAQAAFDAILELADNLDGFEIAIESGWALGGTQRIGHNLRLGSPRLGRAAASGVLLMLEYPGNVREFTWDEDGEQFGTEVFGTSTLDDGTAITEGATNLSLLAQGFPRVSVVRQWSNISTSSVLDDHMVQALAEADGYSDAPTFTVLDSGDTAVGSWIVGDDLRLRIADPRRFPDPSVTGTGTAGIDTVVRLSSATLSPADGTVAMTAFAFTETVQ